MPQITINITSDELKRLERLAAEKKCTVEACIRAFARSCQPAGSGYKYPGQQGF